MGRVFYIALVFHRGAPHLEHLAEGITHYARENGRRWSYVTMPDHVGYSMSYLKGWRGNGAIALLDTPAEARAAHAVGFPVVNISSALQRSVLPRVIVDNEAIGRMAAEHFLAQCFRRFAFYGVEGPAYSDLRLKGFRERLKKEGAFCKVHLDPPVRRQKANGWLQRQRQLEVWLGTLKTPVAVFAAFDHLACMVLNACQVANRAVPEEIAILGCNNDETLCEHSVTPLSSIARNMHQVGVLAAQLLDQMMRGQTPDQTEIMIPPDRVIPRASTDTLAVEDPRLAQAVRFLHSEYQRIAGIETLLDVVPVSRRWMEYAFREHCKVSPYRYLLNLRIRKARELLSESPSLPIKTIATRCGFPSAKRFTCVLRREIGCNPTAYRRRASGTI